MISEGDGTPAEAGGGLEADPPTAKHDNSVHQRQKQKGNLSSSGTISYTPLCEECHDKLPIGGKHVYSAMEFTLLVEQPSSPTTCTLCRLLRAWYLTGENKKKLVEAGIKEVQLFASDTGYIPIYYKVDGRALEFQSSNGLDASQKLLLDNMHSSAGDIWMDRECIRDDSGVTLTLADLP